MSHGDNDWFSGYVCFASRNISATVILHSGQLPTPAVLEQTMFTTNNHDLYLKPSKFY
jgi:hypothetical protein